MGTGMSILTGTLAAAAAVAVLVVMARTGRPVRQLLLSLVEGVCAIAAVDIVGVFTGVSLGFSWFSTMCCTAFGIPGVISLLVMRLLAI